MRKTISDVLREADPVGYEPRRSDREPHLSRERILEGPAEARSPAPARRMLIAAAATLVIAGFAAGYWSRASVNVVAAVRFEARLAEQNPAAGLSEAVVAGGGRKIYVHQEAVVTNSDIASAQLVEGNSPGSFSVAITFTQEGAAKMARATGAHLGRPLAILIDGEMVMAPVVRAPVTSSALITGTFTKAEAERIVAGIVQK